MEKDKVRELTEDELNEVEGGAGVNNLVDRIVRKNIPLQPRIDSRINPSGAGEEGFPPRRGPFFG